MARKQERDGFARPRFAMLLAALAMATAVAVAATPASSQNRFSTPQRAVDALVAATRSGQTAELLRILGPAGASLIRSGDPVADQDARQRFVAAYEQQHRIELRRSDEAELVVGPENWPMPIPLVHTPSGWQFDTATGRQEILDRRIGRDELAVIQVCQAYVEAQREYAALAARSDAGTEYAQHFMLVAQARAAGYAPGTAHGKPQPYYGYYFRILTAQGPHAPGGVRSYLVNGRMTGGFALLAYPATYGDSGIMTFIVNQDGIVFQKNLGPETSRAATRIVSYDPDGSWSPQ